MRSPPGTVLLEAIGLGSIFEAARVRETGTGRLLVAKRARPELGSDAGAEAALRREAEILAAAHGRSLPELVAAGQDEAGGFILESVAAGAPVRALLGERGPLPAPLWSPLARASSRALAVMHGLTDSAGRLEIAHGDVSPDNLFYGSNAGGPAMATFVDLSSSTWRGGRSPAFPSDRGTAPYASPEIVRGENALDQAADTYALAATLLTLAVGSITEASSSAAVLVEVGTRGLRVNRLENRPDLPASARAAITRALSVTRDTRLTGAEELALILERGC